MDLSFLEKNIIDKKMYDNVLTAIRMYEIHKNIELLDAILNSFNMDTNVKNIIIKSVIETVGV